MTSHFHASSLLTRTWRDVEARAGGRRTKAPSGRPITAPRSSPFASRVAASVSSCARLGCTCVRGRFAGRSLVHGSPGAVAEQPIAMRRMMVAMERTPVEDKVLVSIGYDADERVLEIEFPKGKVYQYLDVAPELHAWLVRSHDKLSMFRNKIDGSFEFRRVDHLDPNAPSLEDALRASLAPDVAEPRDEGSNGGDA
jgi:hypothetical protein